jgi:Peptidase family M50
MSFEIVTRIGLLLLFATIVPCVFSAGTVIVCLWMGVKFQKVAIFYGKPVFTIPTRIAPIAIGYIPMGGFVQLDMDAFPSKPLLVRCLVTLGGPAALFLSSAVCLGILHAGQSFLILFPQFVEFLLSPAVRGNQLVTTFFAKLQSSPILAYGVFAAKATACHFFPFAVMPGGRLLIEFTKKRDESGLAKILNYFSSFAALILVACIVIAVVGFFRQH